MRTFIVINKCEDNRYFNTFSSGDLSIHGPTETGIMVNFGVIVLINEIINYQHKIPDPHERAQRLWTQSPWFLWKSSISINKKVHCPDKRAHELSTQKYMVVMKDLRNYHHKVHYPHQRQNYYKLKVKDTHERTVNTRIVILKENK